MANLTGKAILDIFEEMLWKKPLSKITVRAVVERSGISQSTFYRHYMDIYDLLSAWSEYRWREFWQRLSECPDRQEAEEYLFGFCKRYRPVMKHMAEGIPVDRLAKMFFNRSDDEWALAAWLFDAEGEPVSPEAQREAAAFCKSACVGLLFRYLYDDDAEAFEQKARNTLRMLEKLASEWPGVGRQ